MSAGQCWARHTRRLAIIIAVVMAPQFALPGALLANGADPVDTGSGENTAPQNGPAIWKATRGKSSVYLFGTVHILEPGKNWFTANVKSRFNSAHTLALEMADIKGSGSEARRLIRRLGAYPPRDSLASHIGERNYMRLQSTMSRLGAPPVALYRMRPWVALMVFSTSALKANGRLMVYGADRNLHRLAIAQNKRVMGLESMEAHLRVFADMPEEFQIRMLTDSLDGMNKDNPVYSPLVEAWLAGNVEELGRVMTASLADASPLFRQRLLTDRNRNWIKPIERMLAGSGSYFVAAGAGHFAGEDNVIDLLLAHGVTVVRE